MTWLMSHLPCQALPSTQRGETLREWEEGRAIVAVSVVGGRGLELNNTTEKRLGLFQSIPLRQQHAIIFFSVILITHDYLYSVQ